MGIRNKIKINPTETESGDLDFNKLTQDRLKDGALLLAIFFLINGSHFIASILMKMVCESGNCIQSVQNDVEEDDERGNFRNNVEPLDLIDASLNVVNPLSGGRYMRREEDI
jgi:hypothetical protein